MTVYRVIILFVFVASLTLSVRSDEVSPDKDFRAFSEAPDVPLLGYTVWSLAYDTNVVARLLLNHDPKGNVKRLGLLAEHRGKERISMMHFKDKPPQEQKYIFFFGLPDEPDKPEVVLIARFGRSVEPDDARGNERARDVAFKFYRAFMEHRYPELLFREERGHAPK